MIAQKPPAPLPLTIEKIARDLYVIRGEACNTTVYVTEEGVLLVDVKFERNFDDMMAKVKSVTDKPVKYVINTHSHGDHTGGNQKLLLATANGQGLNPTKSPTYGFIIAPGGSFVEITQTLDTVLKEDFDTVVPGHGPVATKADVLKWRNEIEKLRNRMSGMVREGKSKEEIQRMLVAEFGWDPMGNPLRQVDNLINQVKP